MAKKPTYEELEQKVRKLEKASVERKRAKVALRASEERYRLLAENINEVNYSVDRDGVMTYISPAITSLTGYSPSEIIRRPFAEFIFPEDLPRMKHRFQEMLSGKTKPSEYRILKKDGAFTWVRTFSKPTFQGDEVIGLQGVLMDISEYKTTEEALRESEEKYRLLVETMNDGFSMVNKNFVRIYANEKLCEMLGYELDEMIGLPVTNFLDETNKKIFKQQFARRRKGEDSAYEITWVRKDGTKLPTLVSPKAVFDEQGNFKGSFSVITDISDLKRVEKSLRKRERELEVERRNLEEANVALKVLLKRIDSDKKEFEERVLSNVKELVEPYLTKLKTSRLDAKQEAYLHIVESKLNDIISPFSHRLSSKYSNLTPTEIHVANLVRDGKATKEIAEILNLSVRTIDAHRLRIRQKLDIKKNKTNLRSYLLSFL